jgi:uroporphyrinogen decarboxylase
MGMDGFLIAMVLHPDVAAAVVEHVTSFFLEVDRRLFEVCDGLLDLSFHGNDYGAQQGLLFSRAMFQQFFAVPVKSLIDQAKTHGLRAMYHSCGAVSELIPDLVACGVDVLDPVQATAAGMEPRNLKSRFGSQISFHGAISAQRVLPLGTSDEVRQHVKEVSETMRVGGGYIFVSDQKITRDAPLANVLAMYQAIDELGY